VELPSDGIAENHHHGAGAGSDAAVPARNGGGGHDVDAAAVPAGGAVAAGARSPELATAQFLVPPESEVAAPWSKPGAAVYTGDCAHNFSYGAEKTKNESFSTT